MPRRRKKTIELCGDCQQSITKCTCKKLAPPAAAPPFDPTKTQLLTPEQVDAIIRIVGKVAPIVKSVFDR
jgi:hypothetical protein